MNKQKQKGNIEIVGVIVVVLLLVGGVGFIAWNNFVKKDATSSVVKETEKTEAKKSREYKTAEIAESFPVKLSARYPSDWTLSSEGGGPKEDRTAPAQQTLTIVSPSKAYTVSYMITVNGGFGGVCIPEQVGRIQTITRDPVAGLTNALFVESIIENKAPTGKSVYNYSSGLYQDNETTRGVDVGDSRCELGLVNSVVLSDTLDTTLMGASIRMNKFDVEQTDGSKTVTTDASLLQDAYRTDEYKDAVQILKSMKLSK